LPSFLFRKKSIGQNKISKALKTWNQQTIHYTYVENLSTTDTITFLDTREKEEYDVSHLKNAIWIGYKKFDEQK